MAKMQLPEIPKFKLIGISLVFFIVAGSVALTFLPEVLSTQCLTPDHQWIENGTRVIGYMLECP